MLQPLVPPDPASLAVPIDPKSISDALHILKLTGPVIHPDLVSQIMQALPAVVTFCGDSNVAVRCAVELADAHHAAVLPLLLR